MRFTVRDGALRRPPFLWGLLLVLLAGVVGIASLAWLTRSQMGVPAWARSAGPGDVGALAALDFYGQVPDFSLIERSGRTVALADLRGKVWIVNFAYTQCTETCPTQTAQMARLQADLAGEKDVRLVSITVNPEEDTPERLAEYAEGYGADPERWFFLTGPQAAIYRLAIEGFHLGVVEVPPEEVHVHADGTQHVHAVPVGQQFIHSSRFVLVDRQGQIRGYYHGTDPEALQRLRQAVKTVLREKNP